MGRISRKAPIVSTLLMAMLAWPWGTAINAVEAAARQAEESVVSPAGTLKPAGIPQLHRLGKCGRKAETLIAADPDEPGNLDDDGVSIGAASVVSSLACLASHDEAPGGLVESGPGFARATTEVPYRLRC